MKLLVLLALTSVAHADEPVDRAKQLYADGKRFYDVADYTKAIDAWKQAYVLASAPMLLFNIGQAYRLSGDCPQALRFYANYEREAPKPANKDELAEARGRCDPHPINANPPEPVVVVVAKPVRSDPPDLALPLPRREPADDGATLRYAGLGTAGAGAVLVITSLVLGSRAADAARDVEHFRGEWTPVQQHDLEQHGQTLSTWAVITGIAGGVGLVGGAALYFLGHRRGNLTLDAHASGAGVSWSGSF
jgi:tetratricopeptide (TPR) repeat protein